MNGGHLIQQRHGSVVVDHDVIEQADGCAAGAHSGELASKVIDDRVHARLRLFDYILLAHRLTPFYDVSSFEFRVSSSSTNQLFQSDKLKFSSRTRNLKLETRNYLDRQTFVPTFSPATTRPMFPGWRMLNTIIGRLLSMQREMAEAS